jgi:hypothetical protein
MKYSKPEVVLAGRASELVQKTTKGGDNMDSLEETYSPPAYEADE